MVATMPQPFRNPDVDFASEKIDALLITGAANVRYLTGYTGSNGLLVVAAEAATFFTDPRYAIQAAQEVSVKVRVVTRGGLAPAAAKLLRR